MGNIRRWLWHPDVAWYVAASGFASVVLSLWPPVAQNWDSLAYSQWAERGQTSFVADHALSNAVLYAAFLVARACGVPGRALEILQSANALFGGACVGLFFLMSRALGHTRLNASCLAGLLLFSYSFWHFAGTAGIYVVTALFQLLAWLAILPFFSSPTPTRGAISGIAVAVALLAHRANATLVAMFITALSVGRLTSRLRFSTACAHLGALGIALGIGYVGLGALSGVRTPGEFLIWSTGYLSRETLAAGYTGTGGLANRLSLPALEQAFKASVNAVIAPEYGTGFGQWVRIAILVTLAAVQVIGGIAILRNRSMTRGLPYLIATGNAALLAVLIWWWEPQNPTYWLVAVIPFLVALSLGLSEAIKKREGESPRSLSMALVLGVLGLALFNFSAAVWPEHVKADWRAGASQMWATLTNPDDLLIVGSGDLVPYLRYFQRRDNVVYLPQLLYDHGGLEGMARRLEEMTDAALEEGRAVLVTSDATAVTTFFSETIRAGAKAVAEHMLSECKWEKAFEYTQDWSERVVVYRLVGTSCRWRESHQRAARH